MLQVIQGSKLDETEMGYVALKLRTLLRGTEICEAVLCLVFDACMLGCVHVNFMRA